MSEHHPCHKYPEIECRSRACSEKTWMQGDKVAFYCGEDPHERPTGNTKVENMTDFQKGARAFYDSLMFRSANHWHGRPEANKICEQENKLIQEWAEDALEEVSPQSYNDWISAEESYNRGRDVGYNAALRDMNEQEEDELDHDEVHGKRNFYKRAAVQCWIIPIVLLGALIGNVKAQLGLSVTSQWALVGIAIAFSIVAFYCTARWSVMRTTHNGSVPPLTNPPTLPPQQVPNDQPTKD